MQFVINSVSGLNLNVTFTFDDNTTSTQTIAAIPYDVTTQDEDGNLVNTKINPIDNITQFLTEYAEAYQAGVALQTQEAAALNDLIGQTLTSS